MSSWTQSCEPVRVLGVVVDRGLADPPGGLVGRFAEGDPGLEHHRPAGIGLGPDDVPRLAPHRLEEARVEPVDVDVVALVGAGRDALELGRRLGQPRPEVPDEVAH